MPINISDWLPSRQKLRQFRQMLNAPWSKPENGAPLIRPAADTPANLKIGLALGGGAARGFAHIGVIKTLESQGISPEIVAGTSAGAVVGALYASGLSGFELQRTALQLDQGDLSDWGLPDRGLFKGEALQKFIDQAVGGKSLEQMTKRFGVVATDLSSGEMVIFQQGATGLAVRASCTVPGVFKPVSINGREYVDGGLTSPVSVAAAKALGAEFIIAVDISSLANEIKPQSLIKIMLQTYSIMGRGLADMDLRDADVVIRPNTSALSATNFQERHLAILEGEKAAQAMLPQIREKLAARQNRG